MSRRGQTLVKGHTLLGEGQGYDSNGKRTWTYHPERHVHGQCSCGALSPPLPSNGARKRWHAEHKQQIREATA